jgi:general secretion pathway protein A
MFLDFFGFREQPFGVTPDPRYLYLGPGHREALASLYYGIEANRGFLSLIARPGMGKTTLLFHLLAKFDHTARTAFLFQTQCNSREFMRFLLAEIGIESESQDFVKMHEQFNRCLVQEARAGKRFIVVIDEAQNLDATVLETVRLLSDFETPQAKLLQIILVGQPGLADKLASPALVQLRQRITSVSGLSPLTREETGRFIDHRLQVAGYKGARLFSPEAQELIAQVSEGIPRQINNYCFHTLSLACAMRKKTVDVAMVREVTHDLDIHRFVSEVGSSSHRHAGNGANGSNGDPFQPVEELTGVAREYSVPNPGTDSAAKDYLSPAEAIEHMRDVARLLHNWRNGTGRPDRQSA